MAFLRPTTPPADDAALRALVLSGFCVAAEDISRHTQLSLGDVTKVLEAVAAEVDSPIELVADYNGQVFYRLA